MEMHGGGTWEQVAPTELEVFLGRVVQDDLSSVIVREHDLVAAPPLSHDLTSRHLEVVEVRQQLWILDDLFVHFVHLVPHILAKEEDLELGLVKAHVLPLLC